MSLRRLFKKNRLYSGSKNYAAFRNEDECTKFIFITKLSPLDVVEEITRFISSISDKKGRLSCYVVTYVQRKLRQVYKSEFPLFPTLCIKNCITIFYASLYDSLGQDVCIH